MVALDLHIQFSQCPVKISLSVCTAGVWVWKPVIYSFSMKKAERSWHCFSFLGRYIHRIESICTGLNEILLFHTWPSDGLFINDSFCSKNVVNLVAKYCRVL